MSKKWQQENLNSIQRVLAELYPKEADQRRLVVESGLREASVAFNSIADTSWFEILRYANNQQAVDELLEVILKENPKNEILLSAKEERPIILISGKPITDIWQGAPNFGAQAEKIIGAESTLVPIDFLERGILAARSVAKVRLENGGAGSGFLTNDEILITNNHVLPTEEIALKATIILNYQKTIDGLDEQSEEFNLDPNSLFLTSETDDWTAVKVKGAPNKKWGALNLHLGSIKENDRVNIIQHPGGGYKQLSYFANVVVYSGNNRIQYLTDTMPGSSGSPIFDKSWNVVGLHHSGGWLPEPGMNREFFRNEGILIDVIHSGIKGVIA